MCCTTRSLPIATVANPDDRMGRHPQRIGSSLGGGRANDPGQSSCAKVAIDRPPWLLLTRWGQD